MTDERSSAGSATQKFDNGLVGTELAAWCQANPFSAAQMIERWRDTANEPQPTPESVIAVLAKFHRNSCYPQASDGELRIYADEILALSRPQRSPTTKHETTP